MNKNTFLNDNIKPILGLVLVVSVISYFFMCSIRNIKPDPQITIAMVATLTGVTGYFFGSSVGSSKKDDAMTTIATQPTVTQTGDKPQVNVGQGEDVKG